MKQQHLTGRNPVFLRSGKSAVLRISIPRYFIGSSTSCLILARVSSFCVQFRPLLGILTIPVFYLIGKEFHDKNVGIISAALLTFSYFGIYYSQEAYSYSMVLFVFSLVILFYLLALRTDDITYWVLFGIISAIAFWTHYYVFVGLGVIYLHAVITRGRSSEKRYPSCKKSSDSILYYIYSLPFLCFLL